MDSRNRPFDDLCVKARFAGRRLWRVRIEVTLLHEETTFDLIDRQRYLPLCLGASRPRRCSALMRESAVMGAD
eukprot:scaffold127867_cov31-Tisochrysis_lutea.AAC.1